MDLYIDVVLGHGDAACTDLRSSLGRVGAVRRHDVGDVFVTCRRRFSQGRVENLWKQMWCDETLMTSCFLFILETWFFFSFNNSWICLNDMMKSQDCRHQLRPLVVTVFPCCASHWHWWMDDYLPLWLTYDLWLLSGAEAIKGPWTWTLAALQREKINSLGESRFGGLNVCRICSEPERQTHWSASAELSWERALPGRSLVQLKISLGRKTTF